jgi:hypothetical protein
MGKFYFYDKDDQFCYKLDEIKDRIFDDELTEKKVFEVGEVGEGCGNSCKDYKPRNGKNGRCIHSGYCYVPAEEILVKLNYEK